jgi:spore maturation protein CgeB
MRVFQVLEARSTSGFAQGRAWLRNLHEPLVEMGHEVVLFPAEAGRRAMQRSSGAVRAAFGQKMLEVFRHEHAKRPFDLFFAYLMDGMVEPEVIDQVRRASVPTCNFSCNNTHQFYLVDGLSPHFDFNLHSEKDAADKFRAVGANPVWFPMAANPKYYHPYDVSRTLDVSFVGQCYARRPYYIWHLLENGVDVQVYGPGWLLKSDKLLLRPLARWARRVKLVLQSLVARSPQKRYEFSAELAGGDLRDCLRHKYAAHLHAPISDDDMIRKYSESKISLGFLEVYDSHNPAALVKQHLHLRDFEAPMSGALYFTGWCDELTEFYEPDKEVVIYRNEHELLDKSRYYLAHPEQAEQVRQAGHRRALADHTYHKRFKDLFTQLGLGNK